MFEQKKVDELFCQGSLDAQFVVPKLFGAENAVVLSVPRNSRTPQAPDTVNGD